MTRATAPRRLRCALALDAGLVIVPRTLGSDLAGSVKYRMPAMIARMPMIAITATMVILPGDQPGALPAYANSVLLRRPRVPDWLMAPSDHVSPPRHRTITGHAYVVPGIRFLVGE